MKSTLSSTVACAALFFGVGGAAQAQTATVDPAVLVPAGVKIDPDRELMIRDLRVVEDPVRTAPGGAWTFRALIEAMAGRNDPSGFVLRWLEHWERDLTVNGFPAPARRAIRSRVIDPWLLASGGRRLDLDKAPFRLLAIVNRLDLMQAAGRTVKNAGEGRFVFGVVDSNGNPMQFTVIFEYELPARTRRDVLGWARAWHSLGRVKLGSPATTACSSRSPPASRGRTRRRASPTATRSTRSAPTRSPSLAPGSCASS